MKQVTNKLTKTEDKKHSVIFKPDAGVESPAVQSIYISRAVIPHGATECKLTLSWPDGGQDEAYLKI